MKFPPVEFFTFTEEILNEKLRFLCSVIVLYVICEVPIGIQKEVTLKYQSD